MARFRIALPHRFRVRLSLVILGGVTGIAILTGPLIREVLQDGPDAQPAGVGGGPVPAPGYPTRLAEGYWLPPALDPANFSKKLELDKAEAGKPLLTGTINGFRFFGPGDPLPKYPCDPAEFEQVSPKEVAMPIQVGYVPPAPSRKRPEFRSVRVVKCSWQCACFRWRAQASRCLSTRASSPSTTTAFAPAATYMAHRWAAVRLL